MQRVERLFQLADAVAHVMDLLVQLLSIGKDEARALSRH